MKKILPYTALLLFLFFFIEKETSAKSSAIVTHEDYYSEFDESEIYNSFSPINNLIEYIAENENVTYSDIEASHSQLVSVVNSGAAIAISAGEEKFSFTKQTAFFMGCAFGVPGIIAVAIINNGDSEALNNSIIGFVTSGCLSGGLAIAIYVFYFAIFSGLYY